METNLEKAKRLTRDNAAIKGINLPDTNFFYEMLELAATPDAVDKNDLLPDVSGSVLFDFAAYLTGHDIDTVKQMYDDWWNSPLTHKHQQY
jgi:hypothetical protein